MPLCLGKSRLMFSVAKILVHMKGPVIRILTAFASPVVYTAKKVVAVHHNVNNDHS